MAELEKELYETAGGESSDSVSVLDSSEVGNGDDIGDLAETFNDLVHHLLGYLHHNSEGEKEAQINDLRPSLPPRTRRSKTSRPR